MKEFKNKVMFLTGAAHGFGEVIAEEAAHRGMKMALADSDEPALKKVAEKLTTAGADVLAIPTDVTKVEEVNSAIDQTMEKFGQIDLLINDAGIALPGRMWELPLRDWDWIMHVNTLSQVYSMRKVIPIMMKQGTHGEILNVASIAGLVDTPGMPAYHASKFASVGMTEATAYDLQRADIDISMHVMCPGFVQTNLYNTEQYRPKQYSDATDPYYTSEGFLKGQEFAKYVINNGSSIDTIADTVFKALEDNTFYVLTHPEYNGLISDRVNRIVNGGTPDVHVMDGLM
ncbi:MULTISPECIES: SDR family NAD(P)-dependent oxidoreductase [Loigolactobacillus]|uniref:SDR family NAD(P)-dependent oxidoreductase n=1 Tax=Loigolactobacillus TaxID=2767889 RepID=UPI000F747B59|nr:MULTISPECIES: SDR family NAD(P)-dependent oxidoreductase [Loigolactobacillus]MBW4803470.1 SDR family NAD(P)-dependent oxidoreductase [Loigolactobacillus coryniformis subsp. torquens]MBW4806166.1 SDR family NAD(P)-dependent oxidoreductase [Loigolactobacillus coryniformis subsp. torquens]